MKPLTGECISQVQAAEGWLALGNFLEANAELNSISPLFRAHPDVLEVRYNVFAAGGKWDGCLAIAETLTQRFPKRVFGWLALASAEHHSGDTEGAYQTLASVADDFEDDTAFIMTWRAMPRSSENSPKPKIGWHGR